MVRAIADRWTRANDMNRILRGMCLAFAAAVLLLPAGCGQKEEEVFDVKSLKIPGAVKVVEALDKKEFEAVVAGLAEIKAGLTEKTKPDYARLRDHVTTALVHQMADNPAASDAYRAIGFMETGR
jgi:hypothetical protein